MRPSASGERAGTRARSFGRLAAWMIALALVGAAAPSLAQNAQGAAEALFKEAVTLAKKGDFATAIDKFQASYQMDPAPGTLLGLAMAEEKSGRVAASLAHYRDLLGIARKARDTQRVSAAEAGIRRVEPKVARIVLFADPPLPADAELTLDGASIPLAVIGSELPVDPGERSIRVTTRRGEFSTRVTLSPGATERISIALKESAPAAPAAPPASAPAIETPPPVAAEASSGGTGLRTAGLIVGGVGVVAAGVGTWLWFKSGKTFDEVDSACPDHRCPSDQQSRVDDGKQQESLGRIALIAGGVLAATGVTLFVVGGNGKKESPAPATARWMVGPGSVMVSGSF